MGLLDRRLLFSCLVGIFAITVLQGIEAKGGRGGGRSSSSGRKSWSSSKTTYRYNTYYHTSGYHGGYHNRGLVSEDMPWWKLLLIILSIFGIGFGILLLYYCFKASHMHLEDERAAQVADYLKHQEEQRNSGLPTIVHPPIIYSGQDDGLLRAPAVAPPQYPAGWATSDIPSYPPPDFQSATAPLLPPDFESPEDQPADSSTKPTSSTAHTTPPQIGFIIPPRDPANVSVHFGGRAGAE
ncbi:Hypothetical predicted protein [Cloeon dipterum]|uniref:Uncharacterized protein n=1 Tax=Cloeon dipterum TaxID=197152 RepID=A0A8S1C3S5_9INSE|nr:Hypothetical predicted protein [Cloeon dipterum]